MISEALSISSRFRGPPQSGNGGYDCGRLANYIGGPAAVSVESTYERS